MRVHGMVENIRAVIYEDSKRLESALIGVCAVITLNTVLYLFSDHLLLNIRLTKNIDPVGTQRCNNVDSTLIQRLPYSRPYSTIIHRESVLQDG